MSARTITTVEELAGLSVGTVLVDHAGAEDALTRDAWQKTEANCYWRSGDGRDWSAERVARRGPLEVVWTPEGGVS